jgi:hypothetical protein
VNSDILQTCDSHCQEAILESLTGFRFIETDAKVDEKVNLQLMRTMFAFIQNVPGIVYFISLRPLMVFLFQIIGQPGIAKRDVERYRTAVEIIKLIVTKLVDEVATDAFVLSSSGNVFICLYQLLSNMQEVFETYLKNLYKFESAVDAKEKSPENDPSIILAEKNGLRTSLHIFQHIWRLFGEKPSSFWKLMGDQEMNQLLNMELGYSIISLASRLHFVDTITAQHIINVFVTMMNTEGCVNRLMVECFIRQVLLKYMHVAWYLVSNHVRSNFPLVEVLCSSTDVPAFASTVEVELLEYLVDSLCDLLASISFLPSIYATFDCNWSSPDLATSLIKYISNLSSIVIAVGSENLGEYKELGIEIMLCAKQLLLSLQNRSNSADVWKENQLAAGVDIKTQYADATVICNSFAESRVFKNKFVEACRLFNDDPDKCFLELQQHGMLSKPARPVDIANFLRYTGHLDKGAIGAYLGSLGKDSAKEWCTVDFHKQALTKYVETFNLNGQTALGSLRIFLSAFRLPGEAQQIDRILMAFSEHCHKHCRESREELLQNADVTFLLMFSIIMLNTDRHSMNIKPERKMTVDQFVRNNTLYGKDVNQTQPIPREYLVTLYEEISNFPLRTEPNTAFAIVTVEEWTDLCLSAEANPASRLLISPSYLINKDFIESFTGLTADNESASTEPIIRLSFPCIAPKSLINPNDTDPLEDSELLVNLKQINELFWLWDEDMMESMWQMLLLPGLALTLSQVMPLTNDNATGSTTPNSNVVDRKRSKRTLKQRYEFSSTYLKEFINLAIKSSLDSVLDVVIAVLLESTGVLEVNICNHLLAGTIDLGLEMNFALGDEAYDCEFHLNLIDCMAFPSAKMAMLALLDLVASYTNKIQNWEIIVFLLSLLRDFNLLPAEMMHDVTEEDLLPVSVREEFEQHLHKLHRKQNPSSLRDLSKKVNRFDSETTSALQMLGNALFGGSSRSSAGEDNADKRSPLDPDVIRSYYDEKINSGGSRWDATFFGLLSSVSYQLPSNVIPVSSGGKDHIATSVPLYDTSFIAKVADTISIVIPETKYLPDSSLIDMVTAIIRMSEDAKVSSSRPKSPQSAYDDESALDLPPISAASAAWLENILVDIALRNRERLLIIWPLLRAHYVNTLGQGVVISSYITERRVQGLLKLAARLLSRDHYGSILVELLGQVFLANEPNMSQSMEILVSASRDPYDEDFLQNAGAAKSVSSGLAFEEFAGVIAAGMFRILTQNVDLLPFLSIEQWETLFVIIAKCSAADSFSSFKSFETLAWLLHEPRLIASVPVFCVIAIQPLVTNVRAQSFVSLGAVSLLKYLHTRLEVLVTDLSHTSGDDLDIDHHVDGGVWKKCWFPVLQALANGVADEREAVRFGSAQSLCEILRDNHLRAVPTALVIEILTNMIVPAVHVLEDYIVVEWNKEALRALPPASHHHGHQQSPRLANTIAASSTRRPVHVEESSWVAVERSDGVSSTVEGSVASDASVPSGGSRTVIEHCLETLATLILDNFTRLSKYPSFDKLWLRTLQCLIHFSEAPTALISPDSASSNGLGFSGMVVVTDPGIHEERLRFLQQISATATQQIHQIVTVILEKNIFEQRSALKTITLEFMRQATYVSSLSTIIEPSTDAIVS